MFALFEKGVCCETIKDRLLQIHHKQPSLGSLCLRLNTNSYIWYDHPFCDSIDRVVVGCSAIESLDLFYGHFIQRVCDKFFSLQLLSGTNLFSNFPLLGLNKRPISMLFYRFHKLCPVHSIFFINRIEFCLCPLGLDRPSDHHHLNMKSWPQIV